MCLRIIVQKTLCLLTLIVYTAVLPLFIYVVCDWYMRGELEIFLTLVVLLVAPMLVVNLVSAIVFLRRDEFTEKLTVQNVCVVSHFFQMGLLFRAVGVFQSFENSKLLEFSLLAVGQAASSFLPAILLQGVLLKPLLPDIPTTAQAFTALCLISSALSFVLAQISLKCSRNDEASSSSNRVFILLTLCHIGGVLCLLVSRCLSVILFSYILDYWIALLIGLHFILCLVSSLVYNHLQLKKAHFMYVLRQTGLMFLHIYDSLSADSGPGKCANVLFYTLLLVENILMSAVWVMTSRHSDVTKLVTVMIMLATFVVGVVLKFLCYSCNGEENTSEDSDRKALDVRAVSSVTISQRSVKSSHRRQGPSDSRDRQYAMEVDSTSATVCASVSKPTVTRKSLAGPKSSRKSVPSTKRETTPHSYSNPAYDDTETTYPGNVKDKRSVRGRHCANRKTSSDTLECGEVSKTKTKKSHQNRKKLKAQRGYCSEELTDIASSNSRNTNTLDMSGHSAQSHRARNNSAGKQTDYTYERPVTHEWKQSHSPDEQLHYADFVITSTDHQRPQIRPKSCAPSTRLNYADNPISRQGYGGYSRQKAATKDVWYPRSQFDQYSNDFYTDTTSYYDTLSYYYTVTSSHSSSDSDCARTWPPSLPTAFQQTGSLQLPDEKLSPEERISIWLQRSRQFFSQDFLNQSIIPDTASVSSRFGSNRRTICGYQIKVSFSSTSSRRLPPRGIKPKQRPQLFPGYSEEYRIQFQTYMDSLKTRKKPEGVWTSYPVPGPTPDRNPTLCYMNATTNQQKTFDNWPTYQNHTQGPSKLVPPPRPPRPPKNILPSRNCERPTAEITPGFVQSRLEYNSRTQRPTDECAVPYSYESVPPFTSKAAGLESAV